MTDAIIRASLPFETLVLASRNRGKLVEMAALLDGLGVRLRCSADYPGLGEIAEDGQTFADNAVIKAVATARSTGEWSIADDSGLEVDALGGRPGVYSARFAGVSGPGADAANNARLIEELRGVPASRRGARYRCCIALAGPVTGLAFTVEANWSGVITESPRGANGFGYDPYFEVPALGQTVAEMPGEIKNRLSHRGQALGLLVARLARGL